MQNKLYNLFIGLALIAQLGTTGCNKMIDVGAPLNETPSNVVFASERTARSALSGMYGTLSQSTLQALSFTMYNSLQADDLTYLATVASTQEMMNNSYTAARSQLPEIWNSWYSNIYRANSIVLGLQSSTGVTDSIKKQLTAEAKFVRAYCYFNLVNTFGNVPLVLQTDVNQTAYLPRETTTRVYQQIIADLTDAKTNLLSTYAATSGDRIGVNRFVAAALLARVYLFAGEYAAAESNASEVVASGLYSIIPAATMGTGVFVKNSAESIWQLTPYLASTNQYTLEGATFVPASFTLAGLQYRIHPNLIAAFTGTDLRRTRWMSDATLSGTVYSIPFKYKYRTNALAVAAGVSEYPVILRLAEQYLIRAEARARLGSNLTGALSDLNVTRTRAGLAASTTTNATTLLDEIALENRKEFFCEQGFRWFNLKRTGQADAVLGALKASWNPNAKLLPIPQATLDANYTLTQNPGY